MFKWITALCFWKVALSAFVCPPYVTISTTSSDESQIGIDDAGTATAIWRQFDGSNTNIQTAMLPEGGSWSSPVTISSTPGNILLANPQIAVMPDGRAVAIWWEPNGVTASVKAATFDGSWSAPVDVSVPSSDILTAGFPQVAINASGYAVAVWIRSGGVNIQVLQSSTLQFGGSWSTPVDLDSSFFLSVPQVAIDAVGNAVAVWVNGTTIREATLPFGGSWSSPTNLSAIGNAGSPEVEMNPSGYAVATWNRLNGFSFVIEGATLQFGSTWSAPVVISGPDSLFPDVAVDLAGNAIAVWSQTTDSVIQSSYLPFGGSWSTPPLNVSEPGALTAFDAQVDFDAFGNAYATWDRNEGTGGVVQASSLPFQGSSWSTPCNLSVVGEDSFVPQIAVAPSGYAVVDWVNSTLSVIQSAGLATPPLPPIDFIGKIIKNKFFDKTECILFATVIPSPSLNVVFYRIYHNGTVVAVIPATTSPLVFRTCLPNCTASGFEVAAVNASNQESTRVPLRIIP